MKQGDVTLSTIGKLVLVLIVIIVLAFIFSDNVRRLGGQVFSIGEEAGGKAEECLRNPDAPGCDEFSTGSDETSQVVASAPVISEVTAV